MFQTSRITVTVAENNIIYFSVTIVKLIELVTALLVTTGVLFLQQNLNRLIYVEFSIGIFLTSRIAVTRNDSASFCHCEYSQTGDRTIGSNWGIVIAL